MFGSRPLCLAKHFISCWEPLPLLQGRLGLWLGPLLMLRPGPDGDLLPSCGWVAMVRSWETFHISVSLTCQNVSITLGLASPWRGGRALENEAINAGRDLWTCGCESCQAVGDKWSVSRASLAESP